MAFGIGSVLSIGANLAGGLLGARSAENAKDAQVQNTAFDRDWETDE